MSEEVNDASSVESGSCDCSDYNEDISWFYDSKNLKISTDSFTILKSKNIIPLDKVKPLSSKGLLKESEDNKDENKTQIEINVNINKEPQRIEVQKNIKNESNNLNEDSHFNMRTKFTNYRSKYKMALHNNRGFELYKNSGKNDIETNQNENNNDIDKYKDNKKDEKVVLKYNLNNRDLENNINENKKFNVNTSVDENKEKKINLFHKFNKINLDKETENKEDKKEEDNNKLDKTPKYQSFRRRFLNSYKNVNRFNNVYNEEKEVKDNIEKDQQNQNNYETPKKQIRGKTLKEEVVKETKNLILQPGQTVKPKNVSNRKLKPKTTIVTNEDGTQSIITENTTLTTTTINEILDSNKDCNDEYPLDIQLVKQHITKTYVTEIETSPYEPKKRLSYFN